MNLTKINLETNHNKKLKKKHKERKKESKTLWVIIVIHSAMCVSEQ